MELVNYVAPIMKEAQANPTADSFSYAATELSRLSAQVREQIQETTSKQLRTAMRKIRNNEELSGEDLDVIRLWIIGDAESYIQAENNLKDWLGEFNRLQEEINRCTDGAQDQKNLTRLYGIAQDAMRVAADISNFLEKKERVEKFDAATKDAGNLNLTFLIDLLSAKLNSDDL